MKYLILILVALCMGTFDTYSQNSVIHTNCNYVSNNYGDTSGTSFSIEYVHPISKKLSLSILGGKEDHSPWNEFLLTDGHGSIRCEDLDAFVLGTRLYLPIVSKEKSKFEVGIGAKIKWVNSTFLFARVPEVNSLSANYAVDDSESYTSLEPGFILRYSHFIKSNFFLSCSAGADGSISKSYATFFLGGGIGFSF